MTTGPIPPLVVVFRPSDASIARLSARTIGSVLDDAVPDSVGERVSQIAAALTVGPPHVERGRAVTNAMRLLPAGRG